MLFTNTCLKLLFLINIILKQTIKCGKKKDENESCRLLVTGDRDACLSLADENNINEKKNSLKKKNSVRVL